MAAPPAAASSAKVSGDWSIRRMNTSSRLVASGAAVAPVPAIAASHASSRVRAGSAPTTCRSLPNGATCSTPSMPRSFARDRRAVAALDDDRMQARALGDDLRHGAARHDLAVGDVDDAMAALGLVHVVGRDQHGQPFGGEFVDLVPEFAPRLRIDAGRRLVEEEQLRLVHDAGGERQALLPAAGKRAGELVLAVGQPEPLERVGDIFWRAASGCRAGRRSRDSRGSSGPRRTRTAGSCSRPPA